MPLDGGRMQGIFLAAGRGLRSGRKVAGWRISKGRSPFAHPTCLPGWRHSRVGKCKVVDMQGCLCPGFLGEMSTTGSIVCMGLGAVAGKDSG